jgi:peptidoglycan/xylan/chitin deacetylase (PgdA/CDA1 family)
MRSAIVGCCLALAAGAGTELGYAADCPGNPNALGTSRTLVVDPTEHPLLGIASYRESLPLADHEVVLTFDDGPLPPYTSRILDTLASECVKATFFMVGRMAQGYPHLVKRVYDEGHTIGTHSQDHPFTFHRMSVDQAARQIEGGVNSVGTALGDPAGVSHFFRFPGLLHQVPVEHYLAAHGYQAWSVDLMGDDWTHISDTEIVRRSISRLEARGKGILLLHDIQPMTARGLPMLLHQLKARGFRVVQVVEATADRPKTASLPEQWVGRAEPAGYWPLVSVASLSFPDPVLEAPSPQNFGITDPSGTYPRSTADRSRSLDRDGALAPIVLWPHGVKLVALSPPQMLPAPAPETFRYTHVWRPHPPISHSSRKPVVAAKSAPAGKSALERLLGRGASPKGVVVSHSASKAAKDPHAPPRPPRPTGHQIQLPKPTADASSQQVGMR